MSIKKIFFAGVAVVGLGLSAFGQTRSPVVYPQDEEGAAEATAEAIADSADEGEVSLSGYNEYRPTPVSTWRAKANYHRALREQEYAEPQSHLYRRSAGVRKAQHVSPFREEEPGEQNDIQYESIGANGPMDDSMSYGGDCGGGDSCDCSECGGEYCGGGDRPLFGRFVNWGPRNLAIFGGVHGYKGPRDRGMNGNFGFQEGVNYGSPLGDPWGCGFQVGFQALQSNIFGNQVTGMPTADRRQYFATAGIFRRAEVGKVQWGVAFDYLYDTYTSNSNLKQIRQETGWLMTDRTEIGYSGAYGIGGDTSTAQTTGGNAVIGRLEPTDQFICYIRRYFDNGGDGRLYGGVTGKGDGLVGADVWIPLSGGWALQNNFTYMIPKQGRGTTVDGNGLVTGGQVRETWGVAMNLVWYPGRSARCVGNSCFRPVLNVADNTQFLVNESFPQ
jgi:hypothetical protein